VDAHSPKKIKQKNKMDTDAASKASILLIDIYCISTMPYEDHICMITRTEVDISDSCRLSVMKHVHRLGLLLKDLDRLLGSDFHAKFGKEWKDFLRIGAPMSSKFFADIENENRRVRLMR